MRKFKTPHPSKPKEAPPDLRHKMTPAGIHANLINDCITPQNTGVQGVRNRHADFEGWRALLRFRIWSRFCAWDHPHALDSAEIRREDSGTDGDPHHVRDNRSRSALGGSPSPLATYTGHTAWCRFGRAWLLAGGGIHSRIVAS